jgi:putative hemolysin
MIAAVLSDPATRMPAGPPRGRAIAPAVRVVSGTHEVRLAETPEEVRAVQALRYRVFYEEMGATATAETRAAGLDADAFDAVADHLLVLNHARGEGAAAVVGTYRLIRREAAARVGGFYSAAEYDISTMLAFPGAILELGRSCVAAESRNRPTMQLLWRGIAAYVFHHGIDLMFGCASLPGTDPDALATPLTYLASAHLAPAALRPRALPHRYVEMQRLPPESVNARAALNGLPPLLKGYLRLGGWVGAGAVIDQQFNTTDVCVVVKTDQVTDKYFKHYERRLRDGPGGGERAGFA